jgi:arylsulfatase
MKGVYTVIQKNILLIFTDQQRYDTIAALGNRIIKTPVLDSLVEKGTAFSRAYTPCPVCIPARYAMCTGQMPHRSNCLENETACRKKSFIEILSENGYQSHGVGKMHFNLEGEDFKTLWGFESRETSEGEDDEDFGKYLKNNGYGYVYDTHGVRSEMYYIPQPSQLPERLHETTWVADRSIQFLKERDQKRPFFLKTSFMKPHPPFESPTPWNKLYRGAEMPLPIRPQDSENLITYWNRFQNRYKYRDQGIDDNLIRSLKAAYYSTISFIDYNLGRLFDYMRENNLLDNTLIVFTSDHGEMLGDYNCFGKRCFFDSAARIPMIMFHPELPSGHVCNTPVSLVDVLPTLLQYAGIKITGDYCGESLTDIAQGRTKRNTVYGQYRSNESGVYMAVTENYKYIYSAPDNKEWLYDFRTDPQETRNRAYNPLYRHIIEAMKKDLIQYFKGEGYTAPLEGNDWKRYPPREMSKDPDEYLLFQDSPESIPHIPGYEREFSSRE